MSAFQRLASAPSAVAAERVVTLPPSAFKETWKRRPKAPVRIGIIGVSEHECTAAEEMAGTRADEIHPKRGELWPGVFNSHIVTNILAKACVYADDVSRYFFDPHAESQIRLALTPGGIRRLWAEREVVEVAASHSMPEASDEDLSDLADRIDAGFDGVAAHKMTRFRRLIAAAMREVESESARDEQDEDEG